MDSTDTIHKLSEIIVDNNQNFTEVLSGYLTPLIALIALYIAYQQFHTNKQRFLFETYEKRLAVFMAVQDYLKFILREGNTELKEILEFDQKTAQALFLFDKSIQKKISEIYKKSIQMRELQSRLYSKDGKKGLPIGEERNKISEENTTLLKWHIKQIEETKKLFSKKMSLK